MSRIMAVIDIILSVLLMAEASYYNSKIICGVGLICALTSLWLLSKLPKE